MILSRLGPLSRLTASVARNLMQESNKVNFKQPVRTEKIYIRYRNGTPPEEYLKEVNGMYEILGAMFWWWFIWRLVSEYEQVFGPFLPSRKDWTDEELGIPPLDEDP